MDKHSRPRYIYDYAIAFPAPFDPTKSIALPRGWGTATGGGCNSSVNAKLYNK